MFKKISLALVALFLVGCTNINTDDILTNLGIGEAKNNGPIREIKTQKDLEFKSVEETKTEKKVEDKKENIDVSKVTQASEENVNNYLAEVKANLKNGVRKNDNEIKNSYSVFLGETLVFPLDNETNIKVTSEPRNTNNKLIISNGKGEFRSIYRGEYTVSTYSNGTLNRKINISVNPKYNFSEEALYDTVMKTSTKNNKDLENSITLYKMIYPTGKNIKAVNYNLLKYGYDNKNTSLVKEALSTIKNDISSYSDFEKVTILKAAKLTNTNIFIPDSVEKFAGNDLKSALEEYRASSSSSLKDEAKESLNNLKQETKSASEMLKDKFKSSLGGSSATSSGDASYYDKAMKLLNSDPKLAIENFKKSLSNEKMQDKKPEIYYNIANSYAKLGNKVEVSKYLRLLKQEFPNNEWAKKAEILTKFLK